MLRIREEELDRGRVALLLLRLGLTRLEPALLRERLGLTRLEPALLRGRLGLTRLLELLLALGRVTRAEELEGRVALLPRELRADEAELDGLTPPERALRTRPARLVEAERPLLLPCRLYSRPPVAVRD